MRILHIWNQVGVASILAKYQIELGHEADVVMRAGFDPYGIDEYYQVDLFHGSAWSFYRYVLKQTKKYDVIHIHSLTKIIPFIRKPKILHFHGSDTVKAELWRRFENFLAAKLADKILVSTPDMLDIWSSAEWLPNPVDTDLFFPRGDAPTKESPPLTYKRGRNPPYQFNDGSCINYELMPYYLSGLKEYVQPWKPSRALSKLSLEALACGTQVNWNGVTIHGLLPKRHRGLEAARRTLQIYQEIVK